MGLKKATYYDLFCGGWISFSLAKVIYGRSKTCSINAFNHAGLTWVQRTSETSFPRTWCNFFRAKPGQAWASAVCSVSQQMALPSLVVCEQALKHSSLSKQQVYHSTWLLQIAWSFFPVPGGDRKETACYLSFPLFIYCFLLLVFCKVRIGMFHVCWFCDWFWTHVVHMWLFLGKAAPVTLAVCLLRLLTKNV